MSVSINSDIFLKMTEEAAVSIELKCLICFDLIVQPVKYPCGHELCHQCHLKNSELCHYKCPWCRFRTSNWLRSNKGDIIDQKKEQLLKDKFPHIYEKIAEGTIEDSDLDARFLDAADSMGPKVSAEGEVRKYYEEWLEKVR